MSPCISTTTVLVNLFFLKMRNGSEHFHTEPDGDGEERVLLHCSLMDSSRGAAVKEVKFMLLCGGLHRGRDCGPAFTAQIMFPVLVLLVLLGMRVKAK